MIYQTNLRHDFIPRECNLLYRDMFCNTPWLYFDFFPIILIVNGSRSEILKPWDWNLHFSFVLPEPLSLFVKLAHFREDHPVNLELGSCQKLFANSCSVQSKGQGDRFFLSHHSSNSEGEESAVEGKACPLEGRWYMFRSLNSTCHGVVR